MSFNTPVFVAFFLLFYCAHATAIASNVSRAGRLALIIGASAVFYAGWDYRFVPLLFISIAIDFVLASAIGRSADARRRKALLTASVVMNIGLLAFFKYTNFVVANVAALIGVAPPVVEIILPVGISFYTFQSLSYTIDVYRNVIPPTRNFAAFAASVSFFPQLVAGPIVRAGHLVPQMNEGPRFEWTRGQLGVLLIAIGAFKKTVADLLAPIADQAFALPAEGLVQAWTGALAFTGQIYGDFSGYTDIAIGIAYTLGYHFPDNFRLPYVASSPSDFWRRWHISLSTWLRDYLYIPLGGNRTAVYRNLMVTMALGGLWHGASWTFVVWGLYHGVLLVAERLVSPRREARRGLARWPSIALTFYLMVIGWVFFRSTSLTGAASLLGQMHFGTFAIEPEETVRLILVAVAIVVPHAIDDVILRGRESIHPVVLWPLAFAALSFTLVLGGSNYAFIYFQF